MPRSLAFRLALLWPLLAVGGEALAQAPLPEPVRFLVAGRSAVFRDAPGSAGDFASLQIVGDRELEVPEDPRCPAATSLELASIPDQGAHGFVRGPRIALPCER